MGRIMPDLDDLKARAGSRGALHGCSSDPCGSVVCQTARDRDLLLVKLEQAEQVVARVRAALPPYNRALEYAVPAEDIYRALDGERA